MRRRSFKKFSDLSAGVSIYVDSVDFDVYEDSYEEGELEMVGNWSVDVGVVLDVKSANEILARIVEIVVKNLGAVSEKSFEEYISHPDYWSSQEFGIYTSSPILGYDNAGGYFYDLDDEEIEQWKRGEIKGYTANIYVYLNLVVETDERTWADLLGVEY